MGVFCMKMPYVIHDASSLYVTSCISAEMLVHMYILMQCVSVVRTIKPLVDFDAFHYIEYGILPILLFYTCSFAPDNLNSHIN